MQSTAADLKQTSNEEDRPLWLLLFVSMFLAAAILLVAAVHWFQTGNHYAKRKSVTFQGSELELVIGKGKATDETLLIEGMSDQGFAFVATPPIELISREHRQLEWVIDGLTESSEVRLVWSSDTTPGQMQESPIAHQASGAGSINLTPLSQWRGTITALGLIVAGPIPISIHEMELQPITPNAKGILTEIVSEWTAFEGWHPYSINYIVGGARDPLLPPAPAAAVWALLGYLIYTLAAGVGRRLPGIQSLVACGLVGWLAIDARWQLDLYRQLEHTKTEFAGLTSEQKREQGEDGELFKLIQIVRSYLPEDPARVFVISADPGRDGNTYLRSIHAHYYLLPHNVYSRLKDLPGTSRLKDKDFVLLLKPLPRVTFVAEHGLLQGKGKSNFVSAQRVFENSNGALYQVSKSAL